MLSAWTSSPALKPLASGQLPRRVVTIDGMAVHLTHWGTFEAVSDGERLTEVRPWRGDPEPMPLIDNVASAQHHAARIAVPHVRKGWLDHGPGAPGRGDERSEE